MVRSSPILGLACTSPESGRPYPRGRLVSRRSAGVKIEWARAGWSGYLSSLNHWVEGSHVSHIHWQVAVDTWVHVRYLCVTGLISRISGGLIKATNTLLAHSDMHQQNADSMLDERYPLRNHVGHAKRVKAIRHLRRTFQPAASFFGAFQEQTNRLACMTECLFSYLRIQLLAGLAALRSSHDMRNYRLNYPLDKVD